MLLRPPPRFPGFRREDFDVFAVRDREERRRAILEAFHPGLRLLAEDLGPLLDEAGGAPFHVHLPRLDWPKGYVPFCTWLAFSRLPHGYQAAQQLNVGVHADYTAIRVAWDTAADAFGRFEFRCRVGGLGEAIAGLASTVGFAFRVYAAAPWPEGSRLTFESDTGWEGSFDEVARRGVWWEVGLRWNLPEALGLVTSSAWSDALADAAGALREIYDLID